MSTRGLSLKDMGIMGRIYLAIGAAWNAGCVELRGGEHTSSPPKYDVGFFIQYQFLTISDM